MRKQDILSRQITLKKINIWVEAAFILKVLMRLSWNPQTDEPNIFAELEFWNCIILKVLNHVTDEMCVATNDVT